jgi:hypothetical protein
MRARIGEIGKSSEGLVYAAAFQTQAQSCITMKERRIIRRR